MKKHTNSKMISFLALILLILTGNNILSQTNLLKGGSMETADGQHWIIEYVSLENKTITTEQRPVYTFGDPLILAAGNGGCLHVVNSDGTAFADILFYQEIKLIPGHKYLADGAFKDVSEGKSTQNWCELRVAFGSSIEYGENGIEKTTFKIVGDNAWEGLSNVDGTFLGNLTDYTLNDDSFIPMRDGRGFVAPDLKGDGSDIEAWFIIRMGVWPSGGKLPYDFAVDEVILWDSTAELTAGIIPELNSRNNNLTIYPNPVNDIANLTFNLDKADMVGVNVFSTTGQKVRHFDSAFRNAGKNELNLDLSGIPAGLYICSLNINGEIITKKFIIK